MHTMWRFSASWIRAYGSPETQKTVLGKTYPEEPVCVKSLPEGGVTRVACQSSGVEMRPARALGAPGARLSHGPSSTHVSY